MGGEVNATTSKPQLRGLHHALVKKNIGVAVALCGIVVVGMQVLWVTPRKNRIAEFYKNYDAMAAFERMKEAGVLSSAPPGS